MADPKKKMSVADILAAARKTDGGAKESAAPASETPPAATPEPSAPAAEESSSSAPAASKPAAKPAAAGKKPGAMSVAEMLAAARAEKSGATAAPKAPAAAKEKPAPKEKPAAAEKAKPAAPAKAAASDKAAAVDTSSILAAARAAKPGPMSKTEAAKADAPAKPAKAKLTVPPMPERPAFIAPRSPSAEDDADRRSFLGFFFGSFLAIGFTTLGLTNLLWLLGLARFMFPNIITEPPSKFKVGKPDNFGPGTVENRFKAQFGVWIVNTEYEGEQQIFALKTVCTHLGCTPNWLEAEQKFKCPCHGSGFYKDGINFEGPAPRPLERYAISLADDGQLQVDKSRSFHEETGQWKDAACFYPV